MKTILSIRTCLSFIFALAIMFAGPLAAFAEDSQFGPSLSTTTTPTTTALITPTPNAAGWNDGQVVVTLRAVDGGSGAGIKQITYSATGAQLIDSTVVSGGSAVIDVYAAGTTTLIFYAEDNAGNVEAPKTIDVKIDMCYPIVYGDPVTPANANGWHNGDVVIHWTVIDDVSGADPSSLPADSIVTGEGTNLGAGPVTASDKAGHTVSVYVSGIKIDRTAPVVTLGTPDGAPGPGGWVNGDVSIPFTASDELSGVDFGNSDANPFVLSGEGRGVSGTITVRDLAGNIAAVATPAFDIDKTPPVLTASRTPEPDAYGWNNTGVTVSFQADDALSGVTEVSAPVMFSSEGPGQSAVGVARDLAGNSAELRVDNINIDMTAPQVSGSPSMNPNSAGWYNQDVSIHWTVDDELSGVDPAMLPPETVISVEGDNLSADSGTVYDRAGNAAAASVTGIKIDKTGPEITVATPAEGATYYLNEVVSADYTVTDGVSGIASTSAPVANGAGIDTSSLGPQSFTVTAVDAAGNTSTKTVNYNVAYKINPLYDTQSPFKAGGNAQIKLQLLDAAGANVSSPDIIVHAQGVNPAPASALRMGRKPAAIFAGEDFRYHANLGDTGGYVCNFSTKGLVPGTYELTLTVGGDPTVYSIPFILR